MPKNSGTKEPPELEWEVLELNTVCPVCRCKYALSPKRTMKYEINELFLEFTVCCNCRIVRWFIGKEKEDAKKKE